MIGDSGVMDSIALIFLFPGVRAVPESTGYTSTTHGVPDKALAPQYGSAKWSLHRRQGSVRVLFPASLTLMVVGAGAIKLSKKHLFFLGNSLRNISKSRFS